MTVQTSTPIDQSELGPLFLGLDSHERIALGVSGGADSMALMHLLAKWRSEQSTRGIDITVMTVDHGLREGSNDEALWVGEQAALIGLKHVVLEWLGDKPGTGVQDAARQARYRLMIEAARNAGCTVLVVAHHMEDQAETLLMRLARGSGIDGLAGMARVSVRDGVELYRPFLDISKDRLKATLERLGGAWLDDPSNDNDRFERVRIRKAMALLAPLGILPEPLARSVGRLRRVRDALETKTGRALSTCLDCHEGAFGEIDGVSFFAQSGEIRLRILGEVIGAFGGRTKAPRLARLETLQAALDQAFVGCEKYSASLGGALIRYDGKSIHVFREPLRGDIEPLTLFPGSSPVVWDGRFEVSLGAEVEAGIDGGALFVGALGEEGLEILGALGHGDRDIPRAARMALPALRSGNTLMAVPHLDYWGNDDLPELRGGRLSKRVVEVSFILGKLCQRRTDDPYK